MRKILVLATAVLVGGVATATAVRAQSAQAKPSEATNVCTIKVTGMTCAGCEAAVKIAAKQVDGVKGAKASYAKGTAEVTYDSARTSPDAIAKAITQKTGYKTEVAKSPPHRAEERQSAEHRAEGAALRDVGKPRLLE